MIDNKTKKWLKQRAHELLKANTRKGYSPWAGRKYFYIAPSLKNYPYQWYWDSCFHAIVSSHFSERLPKKEIINLLSAMGDDGFLPHYILWAGHEHHTTMDFLGHLTPFMEIRYFASPHTSSLTQPPVLALAIEKIMDMHPDKVFLSEVLSFLKKHYRWWKRERDPDNDNLVSIIAPVESGLDNSPKYDDVLRLGEKDSLDARLALWTLLHRYHELHWNRKAIFESGLFDVEDVLVNCIYAHGLRALARLCSRLADPEAAEFSGLADSVEEAILSRCWNEEKQAFFDLVGPDERQAEVLTCSSLMPLILDNIDAGKRKALVESHLANPDEFNLDYPVPSVAKSERSFHPAPSMLLWRGPTWVNINWFLTKGLRKHGYHQRAEHIVERTVAMIQKSGFREYYNPLTGEGGGAQEFGWSTLVVDMIL